MEPTTVLLVDDHPMFLRIAGRFLGGRPGASIVGTVGGGAEALAKAEELRPRLVLLDLAMPGLSGLEVIPRLLSLLPECRIIVLTLHDSEGYRRMAMAAGADGFVAKPSLISDLLPAMEEALRSSRDGFDHGNPVPSAAPSRMAPPTRG